ncbi:MAG: hypothetical protein CSA72_08385 [Rhodobacterales bacterium]|nr:MAG: hypothetical protein CSA72_08385 [Rhodobacterales bacterium]
MSASSNAARIGVWGASGSGKSSYVKKEIRRTRRLVVFDPLDEYAPLMRAPANVNGPPTANVNAPPIPASTNDLDAVRLAMRNDWAGFRVAYVPQSGKEPLALSALCRLLMRAQQPFKDGKSNLGLTLVVEEMNLPFPVHGGAQKCPGFAEICSRGRHYGITVYGLSQRIAEVSTRFRGNCTETVVLRQQGPRDIAAAMDATGASKAQITGLKNLHYIHAANGNLRGGKINHRK